MGILGYSMLLLGLAVAHSESPKKTHHRESDPLILNLDSYLDGKWQINSCLFKKTQFAVDTLRVFTGSPLMLSLPTQWPCMAIKVSSNWGEGSMFW